MKALIVGLLGAAALTAGCGQETETETAPELGSIESAISGGNQDFEVWLVDQSNSNGKAFGGTIHVYDGDDLMGPNPSAAVPTDVIDLGGATDALCFAQTGAHPVRPHMLVFNSTDSHAVLSFVASGHVVFFDAPTRTPLACFRMSAGAGGARQAHAVWPTPDDQYVLVANQNGKLFERITTDYATGTFVHDTSATLNLATCTTPNGLPCESPALRPDNAPICPFVPSTGYPAFISLRGGGHFAVDPESTPMAIVAEYDKSAIGANGCGLQEVKHYIYLNAGGGTASNLDEFSIYRVPKTGYSAANPPNTPAAELVFNDPAEHRDAHGVATTKNEKYVWMFDRDANVAEVFRSETGDHEGTVSLASGFSADPTFDLIAVDPKFRRFFGSLRGPTPLSGDPHSSTGTTPGLGVIEIESGGKTGTVVGVVPISNIDAGGIQRADAHGIRARLK